MSLKFGWNAHIRCGIVLSCCENLNLAFPDAFHMNDANVKRFEGGA